MAQFTCPVCHEGFEQRSRLERHMKTSHPESAPSAADLASALEGADFPARKEELLELARSRGEAADLLAQLPEGEYRDAAEVARALGEVKSKEEKPRHQPSQRGGERAMESRSAARIASVFEGVEFPASAEELKGHVRSKADESTREIVERFRPKTYESMADVTRELREVLSA